MSNFSDTVIYKIVCLDPTITDVYVGSTTEFNERKRSHKYNCCNENSNRYSLKIYETIRANGGIDNWEMIEIESYPCENDEQKRERERYWYNVLKPSLNMYLPLLTEEEKKEYKKEYHKTEKYKEYNKTEKIKEWHNKYNKEYHEKNKEKDREYREKRKEIKREYDKEYHKKKKALTP